MLNNPGATDAALAILRSGEPFQWYVITLLALVVYVYFNEITKKNWKGVAAGLSLYAVHWFFEILNALVQHFSGHALWTVPTGYSFPDLDRCRGGVEFYVLDCRSGIQQVTAGRSQDEDIGDQ